MQVLHLFRFVMSRPVSFVKHRKAKQIILKIQFCMVLKDVAWFVKVLSCPVRVPFSVCIDLKNVSLSYMFFQPGVGTIPWFLTRPGGKENQQKTLRNLGKPTKTLKQILNFDLSQLMESNYIFS